MSEKVIEKLAALEAVIDKNGDLLGDNVKNLRRVCLVSSAEELREQLKKIAEDNRLLTIGIIGRVKAGKSSLLNSLFFEGKSVLPKAATPMTAALTVLTYGETFSATVEYFTSNDLEIIQKEHREYLAKYDRIYEAKKTEAEERSKKTGASPEDITAKAKRQTETELKEDPLYASYDQYERMKKSGQDIDAVCKQKSQTIQAESSKDLLGKMNDYVGSSGKLMPFTKSVEIKFPIPALQDICVVDTPGINDPVKSREARTEEYLRECDVVFIISPAGQFVSEEDMELMDRISTKEGVRELFIVASRVDEQLYGSEKENANGELRKAIDNIRDGLSEHAIQTLTGLKENHPEVADQFDQLINDGKDRLMVTSGICNAMSLHFNERNFWDEDMNLVWELLTDSYPDYFPDSDSGKANLDLLSNTGPVKEKIKMCREQKGRIMADKQNDYLKQQTANIENYHKELIEELKENLKELRTSDIKTLEKRSKELEEIQLDSKDAIDSVIEDSLGDFKERVEDILSEQIKRLDEVIKSKAKAEDKTETHTEQRQREKGGLGGVARFFGGLFGKSNWGYETYSENVTTRTLRAGATKLEIESIVKDYDADIAKALKDERRKLKDIPKKICNSFLEDTNDTDLYNKYRNSLNRAARNMTSSFEKDVKYNYQSPSFNSRASGTISGDDAIEAFLNAVYAYVKNLRDSYKKNMDEFLQKIEESAFKNNPNSLIFDDMQKQIDDLKKQAQDKKLNMDRLEKVLAEIERLA